MENDNKRGESWEKKFDQTRIWRDSLYRVRWLTMMNSFLMKIRHKLAENFNESIMNHERTRKYWWAYIKRSLLAKATSDDQRSFIQQIEYSSEYIWLPVSEIKLLWEDVHLAKAGKVINELQLAELYTCLDMLEPVQIDGDWYQYDLISQEDLQATMDRLPGTTTTERATHMARLLAFRHGKLSIHDQEGKLVSRGPDDVERSYSYFYRVDHKGREKASSRSFFRLIPGIGGFTTHSKKYFEGPIAMRARLILHPL